MRRDADHYPQRAPDLGTSGLGLFDGPRPAPQPDPRIEWPAPSVPSAASENAADALTRTPEGKQRRASQNVRILRLLDTTARGFTRDELSEATGIPIQTICARIGHDLIARGYVDESETITRLTRSGKPAAVLFITVKGHAWLAAKVAA